MRLFQIIGLFVLSFVLCVAPAFVADNTRQQKIVRSLLLMFAGMAMLAAYQKIWRVW